MAYLKGYMVPPGQGGNITMTTAQYEALSPAEQEDPDKYYYLSDTDGADYDNIRDIVAPSEFSTAVDDHAVGDEFILGNDLYKAISAITEGDTITPGTNAALAGTIVSQLKALFDDETVLKRANSLSNLNITDASLGALSWYAIQANSQYSPFSSQGYLLNFQRNSSSGDISLQIAIPNNGSAIYLRTKDVSSWPTTGNYGWKQIYGVGSYTQIGSTGIYYKKVNSCTEVYINKSMTLTTAYPSTPQATMPEGYRPTGTALVFLCENNTDFAVPIACQIGSSDGKIYFKAGTAGTYTVLGHILYN